MSSGECCCSTPCSRGGWANGRCWAAACPPSACRGGPATWRCRPKHREPESRTCLRLVSSSAARACPPPGAFAPTNRWAWSPSARTGQALAVRDLLARSGHRPGRDQPRVRRRPRHRPGARDRSGRQEVPAARQHRRRHHRRRLGGGHRRRYAGHLGQSGAPAARPGHRSRPRRAGNPADHAADLARMRWERLRRGTAAVLPPQHRAQPAAPPRRRSAASPSATPTAWQACPSPLRESGSSGRT